MLDRSAPVYRNRRLKNAFQFARPLNLTNRVSSTVLQVSYRHIAEPRRSTFRCPRTWTEAPRPPCTPSRIDISPGPRSCTKLLLCSSSPGFRCESTSSRTSGRSPSPRGCRVPRKRARGNGSLRTGSEAFRAVFRAAFRVIAIAIASLETV